MAAQYDEMGNYLGDYETEEERKRREELANTAVHTQEIKTYGDGTQQRVTKEEIPQAIQPRTMMTVAGPVSPETFARMQQAESGNKDFDAQGRPITSPAGAMFKNQVMPATANAPGFGIRPAAAQTPEEYNRVGEEYYQAMLKKFGGNEQAAVAAYNAGPGRVEQNMQRNQGQLNVAQLPGETQGYLGKVLGGAGRVLNAVIPSAQAGTLTEQQRSAAPTVTPGAVPNVAQQPMAPNAMQPQEPIPRMTIDDAGNKTITNPDGTVVLLGPDNRPLAAGGMEPRDTPAFRNRLFEEAGKDPFKWMEIAKSPEFTQFPAMQTVARQQSRALLEQEFKMDTAKEQATKTIVAAASGDQKAGRAIADELKNQDGSYVKMILLGFLSPQLAGEEAVKLGFGNKWQSVTNDKGESALIQVNAKGLPLSGISADNKALSQEQLASFATGGNRKLDLVGGSYVNDTTGEVGRMVSDKNTGQTYIQTDTGRKPMTGFRPQSSMGGLSDMRARTIQEVNIKLQGKSAEEQMAILRPYNQALAGQGLPIIQPAEVGIQAPQIAGGAAPAPAAATQPGPAVPGTPAVTGAIPVPQGGAPVAVPVAPGATVPGAKRPTLTEIEAAKVKAKEEAEKVGADLGTIRANQPKAEEAADYLVTKIDELITHPGFKYSVGVADIGGVPIPFGATIAGMIPGTDTSDWNARFKEVQGRQFLQAVETMKGSGALSDTEGKAATAAIARMNTSQSEKEFKTAVDDFKGIIQRGVDNNRTKLGQEAKYGTPPASEAAAPQSPADKARAELERRKKEKKN